MERIKRRSKDWDSISCYRLRIKIWKQVQFHNEYDYIMHSASTCYVWIYMLQLFWWCWKGGGIFQTKWSRSCLFWGLFFFMAVKTKYQVFATTHRFNLDLARNRSVVNGDSDKSWFTDNTGLPNCWNMQKAIIKEFYIKERKLSLYTPIDGRIKLIKWYIESDVA